jgi:ankyrin repeat protein
MREGEKDGETPLHIACRKNRFEIAQYLPNSGDEEGAMNKKRRDPVPVRTATNDDRIR